MDLPYGLFSYERTRGNFPALQVINMFAESVPVESQPVLQSRPGFNLFTSAIKVGGVPVKGMFNLDATGTVHVVLTDNSYYINTGGSGVTGRGTIDGSGPLYMAQYDTSNVFLNSGASVWYWNGATLATVTTPWGGNATAICIGASHVIALQGGSGKFFWTDALGTTLPALNFATAEYSPDSLLDCLYIGDTLILFGGETVEYWQSTGDSAAPFSPIVGRTSPVGIRNTGCATKFNNGFAWITNHNQIAFNKPEAIISNPGLEEKITASASAKLWTFWLEGTEFLALRTATETYVYSAASGMWSQFVTPGSTNWSPASSAITYASGIAVPLFGSATESRLYSWATTYSENGSAIERRIRAGLPITSGNLKVSSIQLRCNSGYSIVGSPVIQLRTSRDGGQTWGAYRQKNLGTTGNYLVKPTWRSLGQFGFPGLLVEIQNTDGSPFRISGLKLNEPTTGRK